MNKEKWTKKRQLTDYQINLTLDYLILIENSEVLLQAERTYIEQCKETIKNLIRYWPERSIVSQQRFVYEKS